MKKKGKLLNENCMFKNIQDQTNSAYTQPTQLPLISFKKKNKELKFNNQKRKTFYVILYRIEIKIDFCLIYF